MKRPNTSAAMESPPSKSRPTRSLQWPCCSAATHREPLRQIIAPRRRPASIGDSRQATARPGGMARPHLPMLRQPPQGFRRPLAATIRVQLPAIHTSVRGASGMSIVMSIRSPEERCSSGRPHCLENFPKKLLELWDGVGHSTDLLEISMPSIASAFQNDNRFNGTPVLSHRVGRRPQFRSVVLLGGGL